MSSDHCSNIRSLLSLISSFGDTPSLVLHNSVQFSALFSINVSSKKFDRCFHHLPQSSCSGAAIPSPALRSSSGAIRWCAPLGVWSMQQHFARRGLGARSAPSNPQKNSQRSSTAIRLSRPSSTGYPHSLMQQLLAHPPTTERAARAHSSAPSAPDQFGLCI